MEDTTVFFEGELTLSKSKEILELVLSILDNPKKNSLDLSGVTEIDSSGFQLLMLLLIEANKKGRKLSFSSLSPIVENLFDLLNIKKFIDQEVNQDGKTIGNSNG